MELNKEIQLTSGKYDVAGMLRTHRILYFKKDAKIIVKSSVSLAMRDIREKYAGREVECLTPGQAHRRYPDVFRNSLRKNFDGEYRTIMLRVPADMHAFCCRQGNITAYLQSLIIREMQKS